MIYHLNLIFDPRAQECQRRNFKVYDSSQSDVHCRSGQWVADYGGTRNWDAVRQDPKDPNSEPVSDVTEIHFLAGDEVVVSIGLADTFNATVTDFFAVVAQVPPENPDLPPSPLLDNNQPSLAIQKSPVSKPGFHSMQWWEISLGTIRSDLPERMQPAYRFTLAAKIKEEPNGPEYWASHDPVMRVDDGN